MLDSEPHCSSKSQPDWETGKDMENLTPDDLELLSPAEGEKKDLGLNSNEQQ